MTRGKMLILAGVLAVASVICLAIGISTALCFAGGLGLRLAAIRFGWRLPVFSYQQRWE